MFSERLKICRKLKKATQKDVAEFLGIATTSYQKYELGSREPNIETLNKLADYFDVSLDYLTGRKNYYQDEAGNIKAKVPPDIFNLDINDLKGEKK